MSPELTATLASVSEAQQGRCVRTLGFDRHNFVRKATHHCPILLVSSRLGLIEKAVDSSLDAFAGHRGRSDTTSDASRPESLDRDFGVYASIVDPVVPLAEHLQIHAPGPS